MYLLGKRSLERMECLRPELTVVVYRAIQITQVDFTVIQGVRSLEEQRKNVESGASQTMDSKHLDGRAIDLAAWVNDTVSYDEDYYYPIADAMRIASNELNIEIIWGGVWDKRMSFYNDPKKEIRLYQARRAAIGKKAFADLGHFELA